VGESVVRVKRRFSRRLGSNAPGVCARAQRAERRCKDPDQIAAASTVQIALIVLLVAGIERIVGIGRLIRAR
jgi:hypothetical protein